MTTKQIKAIPLITKDIIDYLEKLYPDSIPDSKTLEDLFFKQGQIQVVRHLKYLYDQQNK